MTKVMGIVNVTPDSFSDGGMYFKPEQALARAANCIEEGADIIDVGGESTRPGAEPVDWETEWSRIEPVVSGLAAMAKAPVISVDTYHVETARRALDAGAGIVNCVMPEPIPELLELCAERKAELVMPASCAGLAEGRGMSDMVYLDPMIGFGTTREEDLALLRAIPDLTKKGRVLVGASRKRIVKKLTGEKVTGKNLGGNLGIAVWCVLNGAAVVRVHDVHETVQAIKVMEAIRGADGVCGDLS